MDQRARTQPRRATTRRRPRTRAARAAPDTYRMLCEAHPDATCELEPRDPFQLLVAVILSAQTTDVAVNRLLPALFERYPDPTTMAMADPGDMEKRLRTIGMFRQKAKNLIGMSARLVGEHSAKVPRTLEKLVELPGVGRKTANVLLGVAFGIPSGVVVDTHVQRLAQRLGWTRASTPEHIEQDLTMLFDRTDWIMLSHVLIFHGRRVCTARAPECSRCVVSERCPSAGRAERVGRK